MRKVGIMSMQRIANYGSFLQAYALKRLIEEVGCNVEFVDYHVGAPVITENADSKNKVVRKIEKGLETFRYRAPLAHKLSFIRYKQSFAQKYMPLLGITDEMNYNPTVDCLVIGSDEVFNCIQKNSNVGYSLELFGKNNHAKKLITYAASFGNTTLEKLEKYKKANEVGALLKKFDAISVRDANSGTIVEQLTGKEPVYNLDPVLTYDYMNCCDKIPQVQTNEKYLILYAYAGRISNDEADWIAVYAKKKNLKVYLKHWFPCVAVGYISNKYSFFNTVEKKLEKVNGPVLSIFLIVACFVGRRFISGLDFIYCFLMVYGILHFGIIANSYLGRFLQFCGKKSSNMWFLHCLYFGSATRNVIQPLAYFSNNSIVIYFIAVIELLIASIVIDEIKKATSIKIKVVTQWKTTK